MTYVPSSLVFTWRGVPRCVLVSVTVAPRTTAPVGSLTTPRSVALLVTWAEPSGAASSSKKRPASAVMTKAPARPETEVGHRWSPAGANLVNSTDGMRSSLPKSRRGGETSSNRDSPGLRGSPNKPNAGPVRQHPGKDSQRPLDQECGPPPNPRCLSATLVSPRGQSNLRRLKHTGLEPLNGGEMIFLILSTESLLQGRA